MGKVPQAGSGCLGGPQVAVCPDASGTLQRLKPSWEPLKLDFLVRPCLWLAAMSETVSLEQNSGRPNKLLLKFTTSLHLFDSQGPIQIHNFGVLKTMFCSNRLRCNALHVRLLAKLDIWKAKNWHHSAPKAKVQRLIFSSFTGAD